MSALRRAIGPALLVAACSRGPKGRVSRPAPAGPATGELGLRLAVREHTLDNGLRVVLAPEQASSVVTVVVAYRVGYRTDPRGRSGFAHLFEHMMFQGSAELGKMEMVQLVEGVGGRLNATTRFDYTSYRATAPAHSLQLLLWAEADRMRGLRITEDNLDNQTDVVAAEIRRNVLDRPYGGFPWLIMPQAAHRNWHNAHNFYGDLTDLEAADVDELVAFFDTYYVPSNAALVVVGDFDADRALSWIRNYFGGIGPGATPPAIDTVEPPRTEPRLVHYSDTRAPRPALGIAYPMSPRGADEHASLIVLRHLLAGGRASVLHNVLVRDRAQTTDVWSAINSPGNAYDYDGPALLTIYMIHEPTAEPRALINEVQRQIDRVAAGDVKPAALRRAVIGARAELYALVESPEERAALLATLALFDGEPERINRLDDALSAVTAASLQRAARRYLRPAQRTAVTIGAAP